LYSRSLASRSPAVLLGFLHPQDRFEFCTHTCMDLYANTFDRAISSNIFLKIDPGRIDRLFKRQPMSDGLAEILSNISVVFRQDLRLLRFSVVFRQDLCLLRFSVVFR